MSTFTHRHTQTDTHTYILGPLDLAKDREGLCCVTPCLFQSVRNAHKQNSHNNFWFPINGLHTHKNSRKYISITDIFLTDMINKTYIFLYRNINTPCLWGVTHTLCAVVCYIFWLLLSCAPSGKIQPCRRYLVDMCPHAESKGERRLCRVPGTHLCGWGQGWAQPGALQCWEV